MADLEAALTEIEAQQRARSVRSPTPDATGNDPGYESEENEKNDNDGTVSSSGRIQIARSNQQVRHETA